MTRKHLHALRKHFEKFRVACIRELWGHTAMRDRRYVPNPLPVPPPMECMSMNPCKLSHSSASCLTLSYSTLVPDFLRRKASSQWRAVLYLACAGKQAKLTSLQRWVALGTSATYQDLIGILRAVDVVAMSPVIACATRVSEHAASVEQPAK